MGLLHVGGGIGAVRAACCQLAAQLGDGAGHRIAYVDQLVQFGAKPVSLVSGLLDLFLDLESYRRGSGLRLSLPLVRSV